MDHQHQQQQQQQHQQQQQPLLLKTIQEETKRRRRVSFKRSVRMKLTRHHNDYTNKQYHACYYSSEEYQHFKEDVLSTTQLIELQLPIDELSSRSSRGLECRTFLGRQQRRRNREEAKLAVFKLQEFYDQEHQQDSSCCNDNDVDDLATRIATKYSEMTKSSHVVAHLIGLSDEREIYYYHSSEEEQQQSSQPQPLLVNDNVFQPHIITLPRKKRSFEKEQRNNTIRVLQRNRSNSLDSPLKKPSSVVSLSSRCWCSSCPKEGCCNNKISITSNNTNRCTTTIASTSTTRNSLHQLLKYTSLSSSSSSSSIGYDSSSDDDEDKPTITTNDNDDASSAATATNAKNTLLFASSTANAQSISQQVLDLMT